jgi:Bifunctional DNA primase/polymerase, N-terminal
VGTRASVSASQHAADDSIVSELTGNRRDELVSLAAAIVDCHAVGLITATAATRPAIVLAYAVSYAVNGWAVFPLCGKVPAIRNPHPKGSIERQTCKGECSRHGHGVHDATTDIKQICAWWAQRYRGFNIGAAVPDPLFCLDNDPKTEGHASALTKLTAEHGTFPRTLTHLSGRLDGGCHRFYRRPAGKLSTRLLGPGFDIKAAGGYTVMPPSIHPDTSGTYLAVDAAIADPPAWLVKLIVAPPAAPQPEPTAQEKFWATAGRSVASGESPADAFTDNTSWRDVLEPHGWTCQSPDPDVDGAVWLHPAAKSQRSATINRGGYLFVWSTNTAFEPSAAGDPKGYTRFHAYAVLNFNGSLSAAACSLKGVA